MRPYECVQVVPGQVNHYGQARAQPIAPIIDFAQAVDPGQDERAFALLERDIERVCRYFARFSVVADPARLASDLWARYMGAGGG